MFLKEQIKKRIKNEKGLTLIELLAVIVILAIIAAIAIPAIGNVINNSRDKAVLSDVQAAVSAAKIAKADGSCGDPVSGVVTCDGPTAAAGSVAATPGDIEFKSEKVTITNIKFTEATGAVEVTAVLKNDFAGERIPDAIGTDYVKNTKILTITESELNAVLD